MFRHYNLTRNQPRDNYLNILNKSDTKVLLYGRRDKISIQTNRHSIYIGTVSSQHLLSALLDCFKLVYASVGKSNMHRTLDFYPGQPGMNLMYPSLRVAKVLLFTIYTVPIGILEGAVLTVKSAQNMCVRREIQTLCCPQNSNQTLPTTTLQSS